MGPPLGSTSVAGASFSAAGGASSGALKRLKSDAPPTRVGLYRVMGSPVPPTLGSTSDPEEEEEDEDDEDDDDDDELSSSRSQSRRYFSLWRMKGKPQKRKIRPVIFRIAIL